MSHPGAGMAPDPGPENRLCSGLSVPKGRAPTAILRYPHLVHAPPSVAGKDIMGRLHPSLPQHRPLTSAHRAGNSIHAAIHADRLGIDLIETDVWLREQDLDIRHMHRLGKLPILWERWKVRLDLRSLKLHMLLRALEDDALLFLDLKGQEPDLGRVIVDELREHAPNMRVVLCGRSYPQLDPLVGEPGVTVFYSVGEAKEWAAAWPRLERMEWPAISIHRKLVTPEVMQRLKAMNATVICWNVMTAAQAADLYAMGVDGFTSDNLDLLADIARRREAALPLDRV